jgi:hypothetical protein
LFPSFLLFFIMSEKCASYNYKCQRVHESNSVASVGLTLDIMLLT